MSVSLDISVGFCKYFIDLHGSGLMLSSRVYFLKYSHLLVLYTYKSVHGFFASIYEPLLSYRIYS